MIFGLLESCDQVGKDIFIFYLFALFIGQRQQGLLKEALILKLLRLYQLQQSFQGFIMQLISIFKLDVLR